MNDSYLWVGLLLPSLLQAGCAEGRAGADDEGTGTLRAALNTGSASLNELRAKHDVTQIRFIVVLKGQRCTENPLAKVTVSLEDEALPPGVLRDAGANHSFSDALMVLPVGQYNVCATPLTAAGLPSADCPTTSTLAYVAEGATSEVTLVSQCKASSNGAVDAVAVLNSPPVIDSLTVRPSKSITACEIARLTVEASDPDGDSITYLWELVGARPPQTSPNQSINFRGSPGSLQLKLTVTDALGASTSVTIPMQVSPCPDAGRD
jgi:hypothetical protein